MKKRHPLPPDERHVLKTAEELSRLALAIPAVYKKAHQEAYSAESGPEVGRHGQGREGLWYSDVGGDLAVSDGKQAERSSLVEEIRALDEALETVRAVFRGLIHIAKPSAKLVSMYPRQSAGTFPGDLEKASDHAERMHNRWERDA